MQGKEVVVLVVPEIRGRTELIIPLRLGGNEAGLSMMGREWWAKRVLGGFVWHG